MAELDKNQFYIAVDAVVFTILHNQLKLLLIKRKNEPFKGKFALPGGFVERDENLEDAAKRELEEETGVKNIFLKKMHACGDVGRDPRGRVISIPFLALIDAEELKLHATDDAELAKWGSVDSLPKHELAFDHKEIIKEALGLLRFELKETNIAFEIILEKQIDKRNFRKQIFELSLLKEHSETKMEGAHRPAKLFSFKEKQYKML